MDFEEDTYSSIFLALKHPVRRKILNMLNEDPATYTQILSRLKVGTGFLNYHLESLNGLVTKNEHDKYILSDFGEAALTLTKRVEEPVKSKKAGLRLFGFKINPAYILLGIMVISIILNAY
ncbi:MAG: winged helix-turn-helix domain-containing protein, partial [Candidatus Bathycorpusculaceae bacterium]